MPKPRKKSEDSNNEYVIPDYLKDRGLEFYEMPDNTYINYLSEEGVNEPKDAWGKVCIWKEPTSCSPIYLSSDGKQMLCIAEPVSAEFFANFAKEDCENCKGFKATVREFEGLLKKKDLELLRMTEGNESLTRELENALAHIKQLQDDLRQAVEASAVDYIEHDLIARPEDYGELLKYMTKDLGCEVKVEPDGQFYRLKGKTVRQKA